MASRSDFVWSLTLLVFLGPAAQVAGADTLKITSTPPGARVEINNVGVGTTPYEKKVPGGYFHRTKTPMGRRLLFAMVARISLDGYATKEIQMTEGPMTWVSLKGHSHGEYWLLKDEVFHVDLIPVSKAFTGSITVESLSDSAAIPRSPSQLPSTAPLSVAQIVARARPAVVRLRAGGKSGSGFLVTATGLIATNAHLARDQQSLFVAFADGRQLEAAVVYIDSEMDMALAKLEAVDLPHFALAAADKVSEGNTVIAIGNPGGGMPFSVTKGIVSGIGKFPTAGPGLWIQTDASINPGSSGGPLLNMQGEVVGINTVRVNQKGANGIGFALSASELIRVLQQYYPPPEVAAEELSAPAGEGKPGSSSVTPEYDAEKFGSVKFSGLAGAEIRVDGQFRGEIPSTLHVPVGEHWIVVEAPGHASRIYRLTVKEGDQLTLIPWPQ